MNMKLKYIYPIIFIVLVLTPLVIFMFISQSESQSTFVAISGVASFLFGLLATYTLKDRHVRLEKIVKNGAEERGEMAYIYEGLQVFPESECKKVVEKLDQYLMPQLDLEVKYYHKTDKQFREFFDAIVALPIRTKKQKSFYDRFLVSLEKIEYTRKFSTTLFEDRVTKAEWTILYFLILLIYISLLFANTGGVFAFLIILSLACVISYLLVVSIRLDRMKWKVDEKVFEPYELIFETLGLMRYYPKGVINAGEATRLSRLPKGTKYRVGHTPNYPDVSGREIEIKEV